MSVTEVAQRLGITPGRVRRLDDALQPTRLESGARIYDPARVEAYAHSRGQTDTPPDFGEWLTVTQAALVLGVSEQRVRDIDDRLTPERTGGGRRRYHRDAIMAELARRGKL